MVKEKYSGVWWGNLTERGQLQYLEVNEREIKMGLKEIRWNAAVCIHLVQDRGQSRGFVNMVIDLRVQ